MLTHIADLFPRVHFLTDDDGHAIKLIRAIGVGQQLTRPYHSTNNSNGNQTALKLMISDDVTYNKLFNLATDAVTSQGGGPRWVRGAGDPLAWKVRMQELPTHISYHDCSRSS